MPPHSVTIKHQLKLGKLNGVGKIFPDLFDLNKYTFITTIHFMVDDAVSSRSFQTNGFKKYGVPYCLTLKLVSKHSIDSLIQDTQMIIIIYNKDWNDRVTHQTSLGIFSYLSIVTPISSIFHKAIFWHRISNQIFIENGKFKQ